MLARGDLEKKNATVEKTTVLLIQGKKKVAKKKKKKNITLTLYTWLKTNKWHLFALLFSKEQE